MLPRENQPQQKYSQEFLYCIIMFVKRITGQFYANEKKKHFLENGKFYWLCGKQMVYVLAKKHVSFHPTL